MLTIFTPAYNRRNTMRRLYESLKKQTDHNFEWLIIDDGSIDGLSEDVCRWMRENILFPIKYEYTKNGGKHRAINLAAQLGSSEYIFIVDSDDYLAPHAIGFINERTKLIGQEESLAGMSFPIYFYTENCPIGAFPISVGYIDAALNKEKLGITGDICMVFKRAILRKYPFPEYEEENFVTEATAWDLTALDGYKFRFYNEKLYFAEYLKDGLTRNGIEKFIRNPKGWAAYLKTRKKCNNSHVFRAQYFYYACMKRRFSAKEICELLELSKDEYGKYEIIWKQFNEKIKELLEQFKIERIALYGFGMNAGYFLVHLHEIGRDIVYGIDRKAQYVNYEPIYTLEMDLPKVDCIFITLGTVSKETIDSIRSDIKKKLPGSLVWSLSEIDDRIW